MRTPLACLIVALLTFAPNAAPQARLQAQTTIGPTQRQQEVLRESGVVMGPLPVHAPGVLLTVRAPYQNNASLSFRGVVTYTPSTNPNGVAELSGNHPNSDFYWVRISFLATATSHYIIDCVVDGVTRVRFVRFVEPYHQRRSQQAAVSQGRAGMAMTPLGVAGPTDVYLLADSQNWQFRSCHVQGFG